MADTITLASGEQVPNFKDRGFCFIIYPEANPNHKTALDKLRAEYDYLAMLHDNDLKDDGTKKEPHYHCIVQFKHPRYLSAVSTALGVEPNLFRKLEKFDSYARYMTHMDDPDKAQYDYQMFEGPLRDKAEGAIIGKEDECERVLRILDLLDSIESVLTMKQFVRIICQAGLYADCRRAGYLMKSMLDEHNREVEMHATE